MTLHTGSWRLLYLLEKFSDFFICAPLGQWVQSGVVRRHNESSFFFPALGMAVYTIPMSRAPSILFFPRSMLSCCGRSLLLSAHCELQIQDAISLCLENMRPLSKGFDQCLINRKSKVSETKDFPHTLCFAVPNINVKVFKKCIWGGMRMTAVVTRRSYRSIIYAGLFKNLISCQLTRLSFFKYDSLPQYF